MSKLKKKKCPYCNKVFQPWRNRRITCGALACKKKHSALYVKNRRKALVEKKKKCIYCKAPFKPVGNQRLTCGKSECQKKHVSNYHQRRKKETEFLLRNLSKVVDSLNELSQNLKDLIKLR